MRFQCLILAGGKGTRLNEINFDKPKPLIDVNGKPFLYYVLKFLKKSGINNVLISTDHLGETINEFCLQLKSSQKVEILEEKYPLGTGGAIKNAVDQLEDNFLVCNGDTVALLDLKKMFTFHNGKHASLTMLLKKIENSNRYGSVRLGTDKKILEFREKSPLVTNALISSGFFIFNKNLITWEKYPKVFSYEELLFPDLVKQKNVFGYVYSDYFIDIGTPESYYQFVYDIKNNNKLEFFRES